MTEKPKARLYVETPLAAKASVGTSPAHAHYLRTVLRLRAGDPVALFNGSDGEWLARIDGFGKGWASLTLAELIREQSAGPDLRLLFAPIKRARVDFLVQKATELGVAALWPVVTDFTDVARVNNARLTAIAIEAAEQCERLTVPQIMTPTPLDQAVEKWPHDRPILLCAEAGTARPIMSVLAELEPDVPGTILIGPEGGFSPAELDQLHHLPFVVAVSLGPRLLRTETAALAALTCWQAALGDWGQRPPFRD